jgi:hypothetical protein
MKSNELEKTHLPIDKHVYKRLKALCQARGLKLYWVITEIMREYVEREEKGDK